MKMSLSIMISKVNKLEISTLKNLTRKCSTNFLTWIKIEFEIVRARLDKINGSIYVPKSQNVQTL